jgi:hypothetical protein
MRFFEARFFQLLGVFGMLWLSTPVQARLDSVGLYPHAAVYIDGAEPVRKEGSVRKLWTVTDYKQAQHHEGATVYRSSRAWMAIDCAAKQARVLHLSFFEGQMQSGSVIEREGILHEWLPIVPDSPIARIAYKVC